MTAEQYAQDYIARLPRLTWRRKTLLTFIRFVMALITRTRVHGVENVPAQGGVILMMNHVSAIDPGVVIASLRHRIATPMTKVEALDTPVIGQCVRFYGAFTVNRGEIDRRALTVTLAMLNHGEVVLIAPEGTRNPTGLIEPKEGLVYLATRTDAVIVPVAVSDVLDWDKRLKSLRRANVTVTFGRPFRFNAGGRRRIPRDEMAQMSRESMYQLALTLPDPALRGVYADVENATTQTLTFV